MDAGVIALITTLVVAITGNIAAWWQLANQRKKDKVDAQTALIDTLRTEIARLGAKGTELENSLTAKITEVGELKLAAIDKEAELRTIKYRMQDMQMRMNIISASAIGPTEQSSERVPEKYGSTLHSLNLSDSLDLAEFPDFSKMEREIYGDIKKKIRVTNDTDIELGKLKGNPMIDR